MNVVNSAERSGSVGGVCTEMCSFKPRTPLEREGCSLPAVAHPRRCQTASDRHVKNTGLYVHPTDIDSNGEGIMQSQIIICSTALILLTTVARAASIAAIPNDPGVRHSA